MAIASFSPQDEAFERSELSGRRRERDRVDEWITVSKIVAAICEIEQSGSRPAPPNEIAQRLGMSSGEYRRLISGLGGFLRNNFRVAADGLVTMMEFGGESLGYPVQKSKIIPLITDAVVRMSELEQLALALAFQEGLTDVEMAAVLDLDVAEASYLLSQALLRVRCHVARKWPHAKNVN